MSSAAGEFCPGTASLSDPDLETLAGLFQQWGFDPTHAPAVLRRWYRGEELSGPPSRRLPEALREQLAVAFSGDGCTAVRRQCSADGTTKLLLRMADGRAVESVLMPGYRPDRAAGCISSQVGCAMACDFCATTRTGFERNLTAGEIVEQFLALRREASRAGRRLQTLVFMGMGEPMLNLEAVLSAARRIADPALGGLGGRQVTVSTVGIVPGIDTLTASGCNVQLAVSLHAPDDATRARLIPAGRRFPISEILAALDRFMKRWGRPVTIQYCLLSGVNDSPAQAHALADVLGVRAVHVNLLRYNSTGPGLTGTQYAASSEETSEAFRRILASRGVVAHFRRSRGPDIDAACGQLRARTALVPA